MNEKVYVGSLKQKTGQYGDYIMFGGKSDELIQIIQSHTNEKGYFNAMISRRKQASQYGETHSMVAMSPQPQQFQQQAPQFQQPVPPPQFQQPQQFQQQAQPQQFQQPAQAPVQQYQQAAPPIQNNQAAQPAPGQQQMQPQMQQPPVQQPPNMEGFSSIDEDFPM